MPHLSISRNAGTLAALAFAVITFTAAEAAETAMIRQNAPAVSASRAQRFQEAVARGAHAVYFSAGWCAPCVVQSPLVEKVGMEYLGRVTVWKTDVDAYRDIADSFGVRGCRRWCLSRTAASSIGSTD